MPMDRDNLLRLVVAGFTFGLLLALWLSGVSLWAYFQAARARRIQQRLELKRPESSGSRMLRLWDGGRAVTLWVPHTTRATLWERGASLCRQAGWRLPFHKIVLGLTGLAAILFVLAWNLSQSLFSAVAVVAALLLIVRMRLRQQVERHRISFERQLIDAMELAARSLRAGHPLTGSFRLIAEEIPAPVGTLFADICQRQSLGASTENSILQVAGASGSADMKLFATSVAIQLRSGGNLADLIDRLASVIRDRLRLNRRVRVLIAQVDLSKRVLIFLPFFMFVILNLLNREYMSPLYSTETGRSMLGAALVGVLFGIWVMSRISRLRY